MRIVPGSALAPTDAAALAAALLGEFGHLYPDWTRQQARQDVCNAAGLPQTLCAMDVDGRLLGCAALLDDDEVSGFDHVAAWLGNVWVDPAARGRGVGTALIDAVLDLARARGLTAVHLVTDSAAGWYRDRGWSDEGTAIVHGHAVRCLRHLL